MDMLIAASRMLDCRIKVVESCGRKMKLWRVVEGCGKRYCGG